MRIIGGRAKGTKLYTLEGQNTRPTLDRVREALFNILQNEIEDSIFLDLFAGSGACGIEAVSRGAKKAILCDKARPAIEIIQKNIEKTHTKEQIELYQMDYEMVLKTKIKDKKENKTYKNGKIACSSQMKSRFFFVYFFPPSFFLFPLLGRVSL